MANVKQVTNVQIPEIPKIPEDQLSQLVHYFSYQKPLGW